MGVLMGSFTNIFINRTAVCSRKIILTLLLIVSPGWAFGAEEMQQQVYKVAVDAEYAPYEFRDIDGSVKGMLPDMLRAIGKASGVKFEFIPMTWPDAVAALEHGKVDMLNMIRTPERIGKYEFSNPHSIITQAMFRNKKHDDINNLELISGSIVALQRHDIAKEKLASRHDFDRRIVNSKEQGFLKLESGDVAVFFTAEQSGLYFLREHDLQNVELAKVGLWPQEFCFTAKKGNTAIITLLNKGLNTLKQSGKYTEIISQWTIKPDSWMEEHAAQVMTVTVILLLIAMSLYLWVFLLRRRVDQRTSALAREHALLQQSEEKHRVLLETMPGALLLIQDGLIVYTNQAALSMFGMHDGDEPCSFMTFVPDRCADVVGQQMHQILTSTQTFPAVEGRLRRHDHTEFDAELIATPCEYQAKTAMQLIIFDISVRKQTDSEIARLNDAVNHANDVIFHLDVEGKIKAINQAGLRLLGQIEGDVIGQSFASFTPLEALPITQEMFASKLQGDLEESRYELNVKNSRGALSIMEVDTRAVIEDGHFAGIYGIARDITDRKQAEDKVQQQIERMHILRHTLESLNRADDLEAAYQAAVEGVVGVMGADRASVLRFGDDDKVHFVAWRALSEAYRQAVDGHCPWLQHEIDAEPICMSCIQTAALEGDVRELILDEGIRACAFFPLIGEDKLIGKFMVYFNQEHTFSSEDMSLGKILADDLVATINRLLSVEALAASEQFMRRERRTLKTILDHAPLGIWMLDADRRMQFMNQAFAQAVGISEQDFLDAKHYAELLPEDVSSQCMASDERCFASEMLTKSQEYIPCVDGKTHIFDVVKAPISNEKGEMIALIGLAIDATDRLEAEQEKMSMQRQVEHTQRLESLGVLAGGIAHDFNNILTAIMGNAAIAERKYMSNPVSVKSYLGKIVDSAEKAALLCKQMLAYSGKGSFVIKPIDLSKMVTEVTTLLDVSINQGVVIRYHLAESLPLIDADESQLQQVMMNLVINASDAIADKSGVVSISTGVMSADAAYFMHDSVEGEIKLPDGRYVFLEVTDSGCGMDDDVRTKLFEPFFTTKFTGRGLGMSAVLGIVRGHHGSIKVYSEVGKGTTFKLLFPVSNSVDREREKSRIVAADDWQTKGTVLIVDDEETIRETAAMMLEDMGLDILTAVNGLDGVEVYRQHQHKIVVVLLDMTMPKLDGKGCFRELRRINEDVKVILSSGYNEEEATSRFTGKGLAGFIQKPYLPDALQAKIRAVMEDE